MADENKSSIVIGADGATFTAKPTTIIDNVLVAATSLPKLFSGDGDIVGQTYYSEKVVATAAVTGIVGGFVLGDMFGDRIPYLGGRR